MIHNRKGFSVLTSTILLLLVTISVGLLMFEWYVGFQDRYNDQYLQQGKVGVLEIKELKVSGSGASIGVKNKGEVYHEVNKILINDNTCASSMDYVIVEVENMIVNCSVSIGSTYVVEVFSNHGIYSKTVSVYE